MKPVLKWLEIDKLSPNPFNPNEMAETEFEQYVAEVRRLGRPPKAIVVRLSEKGYEIVDGEHAWLAAKAVGLTHVLCEVVDADDFEAMSQCYLRNRGGRDNPVRLGQMFKRMKAERGLSTRRLSKEANVPESTIRMFLSYAEAAEVRSRCAGENAMKEIAELSRQEVDAYLRLPEDLQDKWLDSGAHINDLSAYYEYDISEITRPIKKAGVAGVVKGSIMQFRQSLGYALQLANWRERHERLDNVDEYIRPLADLRLGVDVLDRLPCRSDGGVAEALITPEAWGELLKDAQQRAGDRKSPIPLVEAGVRVALRDAGIDPGSVLGPHVAEMLQIVQEGPDYIREAEFLTLDEQARLAATLAEAGDDDATAEAARLTVEHLRKRRGKSARTRDAEPALGDTIDEVFGACLRGLRAAELEAETDGLFADGDQLFAAVLAELAAMPAIRSGTVDGQPAADVLAERLDQLDWPEFYMLAGYVLGADDADAPTAHWLRSLQQQALSDGSANQ